jgi:hypothetical protein
MAIECSTIALARLHCPMANGCGPISGGQTVSSLIAELIATVPAQVRRLAQWEIQERLCDLGDL